MKKPKKYDYREYIKKLTQYLRTEIFHGEYRFTVFYEDNPKDDREDAERICSAEITIDPMYLNFNLYIYPIIETWWKDKKYTAIGQTLVHEVCHILTQPLYNLALGDAAPSQKDPFKEVNERQTQRIANVIDYLLPENYADPKKVFSND